MEKVGHPLPALSEALRAGSPELWESALAIVTLL